MENEAIEAIRAFLRGRLQKRGDACALADGDSLFASGRLDSLDALEVILFLEKTYKVDLSRLDFSVELIDTPLNILALVNHQIPR